MAPPLVLRIIGDATSYFRTADEVIGANTRIGKSALAAGTDFELAAKQQQAASVKSLEVQRALLAEQQKLQARQAVGSEAWVLAGRNVETTQGKIDRALGLTGAATAAVGGKAQTAERDVGKLTRGLLAGSGAASSLGRSLAFASTGFIAVAGTATVVASSIKAALSFESTQRQVETQLRTSGKTWQEYGTRITAADLRLSHVAGFTNQELLQGFGYLVRVTGNVTEALKLNAVAADVARGRHITLASASIALGKALGGSETALRRLGIVIPKNLDRMQALAYVQQKFAGQAVAGATSADKFHAALVNAEETIGTALLPTFNRLTTEFGDWLSRMNQSGRLGRDVSDVLHVMGVGFHALGDAIGLVDRVTGGFGRTLITIGEIWAAIKIISWISSLEKLAVGWGLVATAADRAAMAEAAAASVSAAGIATGDLRTAALAQATGAGLLGRFGPLGVAGRLGLGAGVAIGGQLVGPLVGNVIGGSAGRGTSQTIQFAGLGAGIGTLIAPGVGTAIGAGLGSLVGAVTGFIHAAPSFNQQAVTMAQNVTALGRVSKQTASDILALRTNIASGRVARDEAEQALRQAQAQEQATRGTRAHADAVDRLAAAQFNLKTANAQVLGLETQLTSKEAQHAREQRQQQLQAAALAKQLIDVQRQVLHPLAGEARQESPAFTMLDPLDKYISKLGDLQTAFQKSDPPMAKVIKNLIAITQLLGGMPSAAVIRLTLQETMAGTFQLPRVGPGGELFPQGPRGTQFNQPAGTTPTGPTQLPPYAHYFETLKLQIDQAQASLTQTLTDDVAVAKEIIARIKRLVDSGRIKIGTQAYLEALQAEASAQATITQAAQAAAAKALQAASTYNVPLYLQLAQAKAEAFGKDETAILKKIIAAAEQAIRSGSKNLQGLIAAYQVITATRAQLAQQATSFTLPLKLQLALAKAQATNADLTPILLKEKAALEKALKAAKGNIQKQIDIWNQIAAINQQLQSSITNAYGDYKKASVKAETAGLGLTVEQRRELEARLSRRGPGGTTPESGTGAAGYIIDPATGRVVKVKSGHAGQTDRTPPPSAAGGAPVYKEVINIKINLDGKVLATSTTVHQQRHRRRNPSSRRGPNAAAPTS